MRGGGKKKAWLMDRSRPQKASTARLNSSSLAPEQSPILKVLIVDSFCEISHALCHTHYQRGQLHHCQITACRPLF